MLGAAAIAGSAIAKPAIAQAETEISFFYPVAVGGPITKIIDGFAADFEKENPRIKVRPIYAGTYQESLAKALTAHKSGTAPVMSVLLSTDMFSLIDEDAVVPFDDFARSDDLSDNTCKPSTPDLRNDGAAEGDRKTARQPVVEKLVRRNGQR